jgi:hypothetical protein
MRQVTCVINDQYKGAIFMQLSTRSRALFATLLLISTGLPAAAQPLYESSRLLSPNPVVGEEFGASVAMGDGLLVVGAPGDNTFGRQAGAIHLYSRSGTVWSLDTTIYPIAGAADDRFGAVLDLDGPSTIVSNQQSDLFASDAGVAFVYRKTGGSWMLDGILKAPVPAAEKNFGRMARISGDLASVSSDSASHLFRRIGTNWTLELTIPRGSAFTSAISLDAPSGRFMYGARHSLGFGLQRTQLDFYEYTAGTWTVASSIESTGGQGDHGGGSELIGPGGHLSGPWFATSISSPGGVYAEMYYHTGASWVARQSINYGNVPMPVFGIRRIRGDAMLGTDSYISTWQPNRGPVSYMRLANGTWKQAAQLRLSNWDPDKKSTADFFGDTAVIGVAADVVASKKSGAVYLFDITCVGDFDDTGFVDTDDYDAFVQAFINADPAADVDNSGFVDTEDFTFYVNQFELGC